MSVPEIYPLAETLTGAYERLRRLAGEPSGCRERGMGKGLIMQRGMFTWMRTVAACTPAAGPLPAASLVPARPPALAAERELVYAIVSIITGASSASRPIASSLL